jgi:signal transduction histidine kinase
MLLNTEIVADEPAVSSDAFTSEHVEAILVAGARMNRIIDDLLTFAQLGGTLQMAAVDLGSLAAAVMQDLGPLLRDGAEVTIGALPTVMGDEQKLYSVLANLLSNALKFARPGVPAAVTIVAERATNAWRVLVSDNGVGVPGKGVSELFIPFARGKTDVPGAGVGLASAKVIVEMHGGQIGLVPNRSGQGATAWFEIPD